MISAGISYRILRKTQSVVSYEIVSFMQDFTVVLKILRETKMNILYEEVAPKFRVRWHGGKERRIEEFARPKQFSCLWASAGSRGLRNLVSLEERLSSTLYHFPPFFFPPP